ncbi:hypothetical protein AGABI1DRAFT_36131 [Agaricus bisporus var. burnettii JB137-S8]|uniref:Methyltransferase small domain-containing protein n=1 Tax=Agaricus bisporus var. burnettii (strain JB137-S8 / ATCC MYA-4627 / FGSC 10392) TaxID=597362 RepID=K5W5D4_AGABU|nr:uncharacterized protein AGABI1DRAFT_36131 [Agaricus bisporus var. burnettii JB137-S8]EKM82029.1 hypothetical protein AGABI1DRAFT_36131 [Agaricus bisporus var. burnettii JB137-S8]
MHRRNIYSRPIQYEELARSYPPLLEHKLRGVYDISKNFTLLICRCLTQALLYRDFKLQLSLPKDRLCPPVPNRLNYVLWIQDIIRAHRYLFREDIRTIRGIDIGTGASAIYPLLACKLEPSWCFIATEVDNLSFTYAERNIQLNKMEDHIRLMRASIDGPILFPLEDYMGPPFDFVMCNPPFYSSRTEISRSAEMKEFPPNSVSDIFYSVNIIFTYVYIRFVLAQI